MLEFVAVLIIVATCCDATKMAFETGEEQAIVLLAACAAKGDNRAKVGAPAARVTLGCREADEGSAREAAGERTAARTANCMANERSIARLLNLVAGVVRVPRSKMSAFIAGAAGIRSL